MNEQTLYDQLVSNSKIGNCSALLKGVLLFLWTFLSFQEYPLVKLLNEGLFSWRRSLRKLTEGHFTQWRTRKRFFRNKWIYTDFLWIFLENKRISAKGVRDFGIETPLKINSLKHRVFSFSVNRFHPRNVMPGLQNLLFVLFSNVADQKFYEGLFLMEKILGKISSVFILIHEVFSFSVD